MTQSNTVSEGGGGWFLVFFGKRNDLMVRSCFVVFLGNMCPSPLGGRK